MKNEEYVSRLIEMLYEMQDCPALDEYGTKIFGRPIQNTHRLFRYVARHAMVGSWMWNTATEVVEYPDVEVETLDEFATFFFHEVTHGWCHFHNKDMHFGLYPTGVDEEQVCWDVSRLICEHVGLQYHHESAEESHLFHKLSKAGDMEGLARLMEKLPAHHKF